MGSAKRCLSPQRYAVPVGRRCELEESAQVGQLLDLGSHHGVLGEAMLTGGTNFIEEPSDPRRATVGDSFPEDLPLADQS